MSLFGLHNVSFGYVDSVSALSGASLAVAEGERLARAADGRGSHAPDLEAPAAGAPGADL